MNFYSPSTAKEFKVLHHVQGRIRILVPKIAEDEIFAQRLYGELKSLEFVEQVRLNPPAKSIIINYVDHQQWDYTLKKAMGNADKVDLPILPLEAIDSQQVEILVIFLKGLLPSIGTASLFIGTIGLFLPLVPGTPFLLLSSLCFSYAKEKSD
ncbi:MAG: DUF454 family protein [Cyanobacteriota bacterium ELA615]